MDKYVEYINDDNIIKSINEIVTPDEVNTSSIQLHDTLSPLIFNQDLMNDDVRISLLRNAIEFIKFCDIENLRFKDIVLTGSLANYNYNENSDLDVHIILNMEQISENKFFVEDYFKLKKQIWSDNIPIQVKGYDVEMYIQDSTSIHHSSGIYSLISNKFIVKPINKIITINTDEIKLKTSAFMNLIDSLHELINSNSFMNKYELLKNKLKKYRQSGLESSGEFSTENLVYKLLRNSGYLDKLINLKNNHLRKKLSLDESLKFKQSQ